MVVRVGGPDHPQKRASHRLLTKQPLSVRRKGVVEDSFGRLQQRAGVKSGQLARADSAERCERVNSRSCDRKQQGSR